MMTSPQPCKQNSVEELRWSLRIFALALVGILFLTLYPFRFSFGGHLSGARFPFLLAGSGKASGALDAILNVVLFVPYGFGVAGLLRKRGKSPIVMIAMTLAAGALFSYGIEVLQFYIPERDSGWEDVFTNSTGAAGGCLAYQFCGAAVTRLLDRWETVVGALATGRNTAMALLLYFGAWFGVSGRLQKQTVLSNWNWNALLVVGHSPSSPSSPAWEGKVYELELWDHALPSETAKRLTSHGIARTSDPEPLVAYQFSGPPPFLDRRHFLPDLVEVPKAPISSDLNLTDWDGASWVSTASPVSALVGDLEKTRQFALRVRCEPARIDRVRARLVSISPASGPPDLEIWQDNASLVFWFRNPVSARRWLLAWSVPSVFQAQVPRDLLFSYDGSNLDLTVDGRLFDRVYRLGPAVALARLVRRVKTVELRGYRYIFYALIFLPAGCLLGFAWRDIPRNWLGWFLAMVVGYCLPPVLLEILLVHVGGQVLSLRNIDLALLITGAGSVWMNLGGSKPTARPGDGREAFTS